MRSGAVRAAEFGVRHIRAVATLGRGIIRCGRVRYRVWLRIRRRTPLQVSSLLFSLPSLQLVLFVSFTYLLHQCIQLWNQSLNFLRSTEKTLGLAISILGQLRQKLLLFPPTMQV